MSEETAREMIRQLRFGNTCLIVIMVCAGIITVYVPSQLHMFLRHAPFMGFHRRLTSRQQKGNFLGVLELCRRKLDKDPSDVSVLFAMGQAQFNLGQWEESIDTMNRVLSIAPNMKHALPFIREAKGRLKEQTLEPEGEGDA